MFKLNSILAQVIAAIVVVVLLTIPTSNGKLIFKFRVNTVGEDCADVATSLQFNVRYSATEEATTISTFTDYLIEMDLNRIMNNSDFVRLARPVVIKWQSNGVTQGSSCCWHVSDAVIEDDNSTMTIPIEYCNSGNIRQHVCGDTLWTCTLDQTQAASNGDEITPIAKLLSSEYIFDSDSIEGVRMLNTCVSSNQTLFQSVGPDGFCLEEQTISSTTTQPSLSTSAVLLTPTPINGQQCDSIGIWTAVPANTNATIADACYGGSVPGTRRCNENGEWDDPYCIVSDEFVNTLNMILNDPDEGLQVLFELVSEFAVNQLSIEQYQFLLETVVETYQDEEIVAVATQSVETFLGITGKLAQIIIEDALPDDEKDRQRQQGARLLQTPDDFALSLVQPLGSTTAYNFYDIDLAVLQYSDELSTAINVQTIRIGRNSIKVPYVALVPNTRQHDAIRVASFHYQNISQLLPPRDPNSTIVSSIISATTNCTSCPVDNLDRNVTIQLQIKVVSQRSDSISCAFFQFDYLDNDRSVPIGGDWSTSGCTTVSVDGDLVTCSCNHLTHFAILLSPRGPEISPIHYKVLNTVGLVLVPISLLCMVMVILTLSLIRSLWSIRNYIHIMLSVSLFMAQLVFIIGVDKIENQDVCSAVAVILLYLFLVTFMWMLMEGVVLYVMLVRVLITNHKYYIIAFTASSYVIPALYMAVIVPIGYLVNTDTDAVDHSHFLYYHNENSNQTLTACWLNYSTGFIWSFISPVIVIIVINIGFFIMAIVIAKRHSLKEQGTFAEVRHWLVVTISLTVVMGIAWLVGVLAFSRELLPVVYITTIFIAAQGIILFIILVPLNKQVRSAYANKFCKKNLPFQSLTFSKSFRQTRTSSAIGNSTRIVSKSSTVVHVKGSRNGGHSTVNGKGRATLKSMASMESQADLD